MKINIKNAKKYFVLLMLPFTVGAVHQSEIYSQNDQKLIAKHLLSNIATKDNIFNKHHEFQSMPGAVMASPSNGGPGFSQDYQFHWTRDAGLTMQLVLTQYKMAKGAERESLRSYLVNYIHFEQLAQKQPSNPGEETLGQPKFNIDSSVWEGEWGRPQNDGPAIRAIALLEIAKQFLEEDDHYIVEHTVLPMIELDLDYLSRHWQDVNYGLWEEVLDKDHFFNKAVQRKAFLLAAEFYFMQGNQDKAQASKQVAANISKSLQAHWNESMGYFSETVNQQYYKGGGLNSAILLASLYGDDGVTQSFTVSDDKIMSTVYYLRNVFSSLYAINLNDQYYAPLLGRYANDIYDGDQFRYGNPWVLISHAMAEYYYRLAHYYLQNKVIDVTDQNLKFFRQIHPQLVDKPGQIRLDSNNQQYLLMIDALIDEGDRYLESVKRFASCQQDDCLHFAEQIDRKTGGPLSAKDLSWSYASLLSALYWRDRVISASTH